MKKQLPTDRIRTTELFERNHGFVEFLLVRDDLLVLALTNNDTGVTPTELVHAPERIDGKEETVNRISDRRPSISEVILCNKWDEKTHERRYTTIHPTSMNLRLMMKTRAWNNGKYGSTNN